MSATQMSAQPRLAADAVTLRRGDRILFGPLGFSLEPGDAVVLRGDNGAGKTTLLRALAGFIQPAAGVIALTDDAGRALAPQDAVALVGHADGLRGDETPRRHLEFTARWRGGRRDPEGVASALQAFGLGAIADQPAARLSAGQRRRTALARLLVSGSAVWLLDEPSAPLDENGRAALARVVAQHRAVGGLVVAAAHEALDWEGAQELRLSQPSVVG